MAFEPDTSPQSSWTTGLYHHDNTRVLKAYGAANVFNLERLGRVHMSSLVMEEDEDDAVFLRELAQIPLDSELDSVGALTDSGDEGEGNVHF